VDNVIENRAIYIAWLRENFPDLYAESIPSTTIPGQGMSGILDSIGSTFNSVLTNVTNSLPQLANTYAQYKSSKDMIALNNERARQGLVPLQNIGGQLIPVTTQYTQDDLRFVQAGGYSTTTLLAIAAGVGLVIWLAMRK
jgi:hypothetical protein